MSNLRKLARGLPATLALTLGLLWAGVPAAGAAPSIEGVWSFNGGRIAVRPAGGGKFAGTVVGATTFSFCSHPVGEEIWSQMAPQPDGSYWGLHQWFFESSECVHNPTLGQSAWRLLENGGGRYLRACFSEPGSGLQPTIAADGSVANATFGCVDSALITTDTGSDDLADSVQLPSAAGCISRRAIRVRIRDPRNDPIEKIVVTYRAGGVSRQAKVTRKAHGAVATVPLAAIAAPTVRVDVRLTTVLGHRWHGSRRYRRCSVPKRSQQRIAPKPAAGTLAGGGR
jgi:hypothetical protein